MRFIKPLSVVAMAVNSLAAILPQFAGLLLLSAADYGRFSMFYLVYSFGISVSLSVVAEPWHVQVLRGMDAGWGSYRLANAFVAVSAGVGAAAVGGILGFEWWLVWVVAIAVAASVFRAGTRYFFVQRRMLWRATLSDVLFVLVFLTAGIVLWRFEVNAVPALNIGWAIAGVVAASVMPATEGISVSLWGWVRRYRKEIRRLLGDSMLMDVGAIFTPALLAPILGPSAFGAYRAVSTVSAPVRLILNPLRPSIAALPSQRTAVGGPLWWGVVGVGAALGGGAFAGVWTAGTSRIELGAVTALAPFALAVALIVWANFVGHYAYIRSRTTLRGRELMTGRVCQTVAVTFLPIVGVVGWGLTGAMWGLTASAVLTALIWTLLREEYADDGC